MSEVRYKNFATFNKTLSIVHKKKPSVLVLNHNDCGTARRLDPNIRIIRIENNKSKSLTKFGLNEMLDFNFLTKTDKNKNIRIFNNTSSVVVSKFKTENPNDEFTNVVPPYQNSDLYKEPHGWTIIY
jgi:hypothetical protein